MSVSSNLLGQNSERYTVVVNLYQPTSGDEKLMFEEVLMTQIEFYLENEFQWSGNSLILNNRPKKVTSNLNELVKSDVDFHNYKPLDDFKSFSNFVEKKLENITNKTFELSENTFLSQTQLRDSERNHQMKELMEIIKTELLIQAEKDLDQVHTEVYSDLTREEKAKLITEIENYSDGDLLSPLKISYETMDTVDDSGLLPSELKQTDLADKILELLAQNSQKLEKLESELAQLRIDNSGITTSELTPNNSRNDLLKFLPEKMAFYFDLGSSRLSSVAILQLNELVEILAKSTHIHVVITGFADQTGNDSMNLALSKKRAQVVKNFLKQSGMSESRFIINYYGESKSISKSNQDRRVEIKFFID